MQDEKRKRKAEVRRQEAAERKQKASLLPFHLAAKPCHNGILRPGARGRCPGWRTRCGICNVCGRIEFHMADVDEKTRKALQEEAERVRSIVAATEEAGRAILEEVFDEDDRDKLRTLIRVAVEFNDYLQSIRPWPHFPDDPFNNMTYMVDTILIHVDSFGDMVHLYGILRGSASSTVNWDAVTAGSIKKEFLTLYDEFLVQRDFLRKFRILLDLYKLQIVYAGIFFDCQPLGA